MLGGAYKNQHRNINQVLVSPQSKKSRRVRYSQPNLILDDPLISHKRQNDPNELKQEQPKKLKKQPRHSQVALPNLSSTQILHSPQHQMTGELSRQLFYSPGCMKKPGSSKLPSSPSKQKALQSSIVVQSKQIKVQQKTKKSPIQNHKQTLNKIEQMLLSHGIALNSSKKQQKNEQQIFIKNDKIPVFNSNKDKKISSELLKKKTNIESQKKAIFSIQQKQKQKQKQQQATQLKETVSTHSSHKKKPQLKIIDFLLCKQLGKGKFGVVKVAVHKKTGLIFSLKIIKKSVIQKQSIIQQLIREVKIQSFIHSPFVVRLYDIFDDLQHVYLLMELCCSGNLYQYMRVKDKIDQNQARGLIRSICEGVAELHQHNIIHRDFKPENIVLCYGMPKICDFGWSAHYKDSMRQTFCGTPLYVSPQILSGNLYDEKVDLWAIGILAYQMITGKIPFDIRSQKELSKILYAKITYPNSMSPQAISFLQSLLSRDPQSRKSIRQMLMHPFLRKQVQQKKQ